MDVVAGGVALVMVCKNCSNQGRIFVK